MKIENKTVITFEKEDLVKFNKWKKDNNLSLRKIGAEIGVSYTYIDDMVKGRTPLNKKFINYLEEKGLI